MLSTCAHLVSPVVVAKSRHTCILNDFQLKNDILFSMLSMHQPEHCSLRPKQTSHRSEWGHMPLPNHWQEGWTHSPAGYSPHALKPSTSQGRRCGGEGGGLCQQGRKGRKWTQNRQNTGGHWSSVFTFLSIKM